MRIHADIARCEGHGLCADTAPEVFDIDDDAVVVVKVDGQIPPELLSAAEAGVYACPVAALRLET